MTSHFTQRNLIIHDENLDIRQKKATVDGKGKTSKATSKNHNENLDIHHKKAIVDGKGKTSKAASKKGGGDGLRSRKALNDITNKSNKSALHHPHEASSKKKNIPEEKFIYGEEMFLHDHKKCIEAQESAMSLPSILDLVLPGHDSVSSADLTDPPNHSETGLDSPRCYPEPVELSMSEFSDWLKPSTRLNSPPSSPMHWDSLPSSPIAWEFDTVDFEMKEDI